MQTQHAGLETAPRGHRRWPLLVTLLVLLFALMPSSWAFDAQEEERRFVIFDSNSDARISRDEFLMNKVMAFLYARRTSETDERAVRIAFSDTHLSKEAFDKLDGDGDGVLTGGEIISASILQFDAIDRNGDGFVDRAEFHALVVSLTRR